MVEPSATQLNLPLGDLQTGSIYKRVLSTKRLNLQTGAILKREIEAPAEMVDRMAQQELRPPTGASPSHRSFALPFVLASLEIRPLGE